MGQSHALRLVADIGLHDLCFFDLRVLTSGLLGEQFIGFTPGFVDDDEDTLLMADDHIEDTRSAMVLEDLIGQFLYGNSDEE